MEDNRKKFKRIFVLNEPNAPRINPALAKEIGLNESIMLLQIEFWISISNNVRDGHKWTYQSVRNMQKSAFPFWSIATISRTINSLETALNTKSDEKNKKTDEPPNGYIFTTDKYNKRHGDTTKWFALNFDNLSKLNSISISETTEKLPLQSVTGRALQDETGVLQNVTGVLQDVTTLPEITPETSPEISFLKEQNIAAEPAAAPAADPKPLKVKAEKVSDPRVKEIHDFYLENHPLKENYFPNFGKERKIIKNLLAVLNANGHAVEIITERLTNYFKSGFYAATGWGLESFVKNFNAFVAPQNNANQKPVKPAKPVRKPGGGFHAITNPYED